MHAWRSHAGYAMHFSRSHDAVIRLYDDAGNVIETHEHKGEFQRVVSLPSPPFIARPHERAGESGALGSTHFDVPATQSRSQRSHITRKLALPNFPNWILYFCHPRVLAIEIQLRRQ